MDVLIFCLNTEWKCFFDYCQMRICEKSCLEYPQKKKFWDIARPPAFSEMLIKNLQVTYQTSNVNGFLSLLNNFAPTVIVFLHPQMLTDYVRENYGGCPLNQWTPIILQEYKYLHHFLLNLSLSWEKQKFW